jgi:LemA protein
MFHKTSIVASRARAGCRGALGKGCIIGAGVAAAFVLVLLVFGAICVGKYNGFVAGKERVGQEWAKIDNQYKRRFDLIPNLVETVKGAANFEKSTLQAVTDARASVGRAQLPGNVPTDPQQLQAYIQAQQQLSGALSRLFAVAENYPQLKSSQNFLSLQDQIEGTENRIAVARNDYIEAVRSFNTSVETFPGNIIAGMFNFTRIPQLETAAEEKKNPKVEFNFDNKK